MAFVHPKHLWFNILMPVWNVCGGNMTRAELVVVH